MIGWEAPGPYRVAFTTRVGGVSEGPFASLNLGARADAPAAVRENRRRACAALELDPARLAVNRQCHGATALRARAGATMREGDALWTDEPELPLLALAADCVPIAIVATHGRPALAVVHAGWRGLAAGVVEAATAALGAERSEAVIGPSIGPCCYEVGAEVATRFPARLLRRGRLDLWAASAAALRRAGVARSELIGLCTRCHPELFFSHRGAGGEGHGLQGVLGALDR